jgi:DNA end-binding protein Ku
MPRPFWRGYLKLSLVTAPVIMTPALSESGKVRFHTLNRKTGNRVMSRYVDAETGHPVAEDDEVKGYPRDSGQYVLLEDAEIDSVALESTRSIDIENFVPADEIDWIWYDRPHYLTPSEPVGEEAFCVIRDAMRKSGMRGLSRLVLYRRERPVMLEPKGKGIVLWTLRYADEIRDEAAYFSRIDAEKPEKPLLALVTKLIDERTRPWTPKMADDPVQARLLDIISSRKKHRRPARKPKEPPGNAPNVVNIMDALKKSLSAESRSKKH